MNRPFTVVFIAAAIAACAPSPMKEPTAPKAEPYRSGPILVGVWGVGPIRARTYFEVPRIRDIFPLADVRAGTARISPDETEAVDHGEPGRRADCSRSMTARKTRPARTTR